MIVLELFLAAVIGGVIGYFIKANETEIKAEVQAIETQVEKTL